MNLRAGGERNSDVSVKNFAVFEYFLKFGLFLAPKTSFQHFLFSQFFFRNLIIICLDIEKGYTEYNIWD